MTTAAFQALAILAAVAAGHDTPTAIASATGLPAPEVARRLMRNGSQAFEPKFKWFARVGVGRWALTAPGERKLRGAQ